MYAENKLPNYTQPADVTDEQIIAIKKSTRAVDPTQPWGDTLAFARAILALQPKQASVLVPMTDDQIRSMCKQGWVFETVKQWARIIEAHHGIKQKEQA